MHPLQIVLPHGMVTGSRKGQEQFGHCMNLTISLASREASRGSLRSVVFGRDDLGVLESGGRGWVSAVLSGKEDDIMTLRPAKTVKCIYIYIYSYIFIYISSLSSLLFKSRLKPTLAKLFLIFPLCYSSMCGI